jgi:hypothetical protein
MPRHNKPTGSFTVHPYAKPAASALSLDCRFASDRGPPSIIISYRSRVARYTAAFRCRQKPVGEASAVAASLAGTEIVQQLARATREASD